MADSIRLAALTDIGNLEKQFNEDFTLAEVVTTADGVELAIAVVCDGTSQSPYGAAAAREAAVKTLEYIQSQAAANNIPLLLTNAVRYANQYVYSQFTANQTLTNTTIALAAVDMREKPAGRLFIASVGDSFILLVSSGEDGKQPPKMLRLNMPHNRMTSAILEGMPPQQAQFLDKASALTQAIGYAPDVNVDIGFYLSENYAAEVKAARKRGEVGLKLTLHDTIFVTSDGIFDQSMLDGSTMVTEAEFFRHTLDVDPELAVRQMIGYAKSRRPADNISIATIMIPGQQRRVRQVGSLTPAMQGGLAFAAVVVCLIIAALAYSVIESRIDEEEAKQTQTAVAQENAMTSTAVQNQNATKDASTAVAIFDQNATFTAIPLTETQSYINTLTAMPTNTHTPTSTATHVPTERPAALRADEFGFRNSYSGVIGSGGAEVLYDALSPENDEFITLMEFDSYVIDQNNTAPDPAYFYSWTGTKLIFDRVGANSIDIRFGHNSPAVIVVDAGQFADQGITVSLADEPQISLQSTSSCFSAAYNDAGTEVSFSCYSSIAEDCRVATNFKEYDEYPPIGAYQEVRIDIAERSILETRTIDWRVTEAQWDIINGYTGVSLVCLESYLDTIDTDGDNVPDWKDECPTRDGLGRTNGCPPPPTPTPIPPTLTPIPRNPIPSNSIPPNPIPPNSRPDTSNPGS